MQVQIFKERLERLLKAIEEERMVPFLGAGFSVTAGKPEGFGPTAVELAARLHKFIKAQKLGNDKNLKMLLEDELLTSNLPYLARLAEVATWLVGDPAQILAALEVNKFTEMTPSRAHRYLAYLVREGLIDEVITTNYDTCIETAYENSFGGIPSGKNQAVIHDLETFRASSAQSITQVGRPFLKIYKINGCAQHYVDSCRNFRIELTERELQSLENRQWAKDLLRMRARNRSLFFIGFGSDEPQVRFTMLELINEFSTSTKGCPPRPWETWELPNAPFVHAYEKHLSFSQLQLLCAFWDAHQCPPALPPPTRTPLTIPSPDRITGVCFLIIQRASSSPLTI